MIKLSAIHIIDIGYLLYKAPVQPAAIETKDAIRIQIKEIEYSLML